MKIKAVPACIYIILFLTIYRFNLQSAYSFGNHSHFQSIKTRLKYSAAIKRLTFYKKELSFISSEISAKEYAESDLKKKIKNDEVGIKRLKKKIKNDRLLIKNITLKIFIIHKEYGSDRLLSFKNGMNNFVINYQLKTLLKKEEEKFLKLVKRKKRFSRLKKYLKKEKRGLIGAVKSIKGSKKRLEKLIVEASEYIKSLKIRNNYKFNKIKSGYRNKKNRLLKRKVIKLIKNLKNGYGRNYIKFKIIK